MLLNQFLLNRTKRFPEPITTTTTTVTTTTTTNITTSTTTSGGGGHTGDIMKEMADKMETNAPANFSQQRGGVDYGKSEVVTYQSKDGNCQKKMTVILPAGYNTNENILCFM